MCLVHVIGGECLILQWLTSEDVLEPEPVNDGSEPPSPPDDGKKS